jgi:hypothetical protein
MCPGHKLQKSKYRTFYDLRFSRKVNVPEFLLHYAYLSEYIIYVDGKFEYSATLTVTVNCANC